MKPKANFGILYDRSTGKPLYYQVKDSILNLANGRLYYITGYNVNSNNLYNITEIGSTRTLKLSYDCLIDNYDMYSCYYLIGSPVISICNTIEGVIDYIIVDMTGVQRIGFRTLEGIGGKSEELSVPTDFFISKFKLC